MTMPNMTGADLARKIMAIRPDMPVILCTGYSEIMTEQKAREIGIRSFIMKPVNRSDLGTVIRDVLDAQKK
jgi:DNA-binding NtrC family response regulator